MLLNRSATKKHIMEKLKELRPTLGITQVSAESLQNIEARLKVMIDEQIKSHPSSGKTFKVEL